MSLFRQYFLVESIANLTALQKKFAEGFTENGRREAFQVIHTVKGGAQTFGLENAARLAHELENLLSVGSEFINQNLLLEGVEALQNSLRENESAVQPNVLEKLQGARQKKTQSHVLLTAIDSKDFRSFSEPERGATVNALREGKSVYCADAGFELANFADEYRALRKILGEKSELIASLPSDKYKSAGEIGFRIFFASREPYEKLRAATKDFTIDFFSHDCAGYREKNLYKMLTQIAFGVENTAEKTGKQISLTIIANDATLGVKRTKTFFDILSHLARNGVDHAIERNGAIEIRLFEEAEGTYLSVADDGRGIDLEKVRARAIEEKLIAREDLLTEEQIRSLIFAPGFSTAARVTEISGRGVGLDAVKTSVEKMNGKISFKMRKPKGTIFEIFVPRENV